MAVVYATSDNRIFAAGDGTLLALSTALSDEQCRLSALWEKCVWLPGMGSPFALRHKPSFVDYVCLRGYVASAEMYKDSGAYIALQIKHNDVRPSLAKCGSGVSEICLDCATRMSNQKHSSGELSVQIDAFAASTLGQCISGNCELSISTSASCEQYRLRQIGDLSDKTLQDVSSWSLHDFYYLEV